MHIIAALALANLSSGVHATEPTRLAHNPFTRPSSEVTRDVSPTPRADGSTPELDLRATLVAYKDRLANVGGRILRPGDEVHGYTLLQVFEDRAVFSIESRQLTIYVKPEPEEGDE
ncbi:MAG: hypothetical protein OER97_09505 [Gammaproteobacteria bacterium]|nr:hypothetical protein [Gammaproteobacteria bacterium]